VKYRKLNILIGLITAIVCLEIVARLLGFGETVRVELHDKIE